MRNCCEIISQMIEKIPDDKIEFIKDLKWNYEITIYINVLKWQKKKLKT